MELMEHQIKAKDQLSSGKILYGGVGRGKSAASLAYYVEKETPKDIYVITTAKKRNSLDWIGEAANFTIGEYPAIHGRIVVDSWNNIDRYTDVRGAFFIFDEQRVVGHGAWVKAFLKICRGEGNTWILLTGTPGDTWSDYAPVFVANGYYKNLTDFRLKHVKLKPFMPYPVIECYLNEHKLELLRNEVLVEMGDFEEESKRVLNWTPVGYDKELFDQVWRKRWHVYEDRPLKDAGEKYRVARKLVNSDPSRIQMIRETILKCRRKVIIFYNFNYELEILRGLSDVIPVYEYNGFKKDEIPESGDWVYLVQYVAGAESWNCTETDSMVLYSLTYSYKNFEQAQGRIDRINTKFPILYYWIMSSYSEVDKMVRQSLEKKEDFNERKAERELEKNRDEFEEVLGERFEACEI